ncbi:hypothetical protein BLNAU_12835 [Blattamonas nauphoetae]|uniref:Uncharacterized protein n=1 Tax=Blattamonas nauphoetae TaxID=2049346 RepID=A0ABQ9XJU3_9EUKA|nr:hypothetical protein BLNAU_12835 [Blattamonas nauphoetae]
MARIFQCQELNISVAAHKVRKTCCHYFFLHSVWKRYLDQRRQQKQAIPISHSNSSHFDQPMSVGIQADIAEDEQ